MTTKDYQHEMVKNVLNAWRDAQTEEEKRKAMKLFTEYINDEQFWTEERMKDYLNYQDEPVGSVCPMFKAK